MGLKEGGVRGSLRNVSVGVPGIPDSGGTRQWPVQEGEATTIEDVIGSADLTLNTDFTAAEPNAVDGRILDPDGTGDVASNTSVNSPTGDMTLAVTLDGGYDGGSAMIEYGDSTVSSNSVRTFRSISSGAVSFSAFSDQGNAYTATASPGSGLVRIAGVLDTTASEVRIYVNGTQQDVTGTGSDTFDNAASQLYMAARQDGEFHYGGRIDNPAEDNEVWSDTRIQEDTNDQPWS